MAQRCRHGSGRAIIAQLIPVTHRGTGSPYLNDRYRQVQLDLEVTDPFGACVGFDDTLDAVTVRLDKTFEKGQAYVALSRCRTISGMKVDGFNPRKIRAHPTVLAFYDRIAQGKPLQVSSFYFSFSTMPPLLKPLCLLDTSTISTSPSTILTPLTNDWEQTLREAIDAHLTSTSGSGSGSGSGSQEIGGSETSRQRFFDRARELYDKSRKREREDSVASISSAGGEGGEMEEGTLEGVKLEGEGKGDAKKVKPRPKRNRSHWVGR